MAPEMIARFDKALEAERANAAGGALDADLARLTAALAKAETAQANLITAIAEGAPFAAFKAKSAELEAEIAGFQDRIRQTEARISRQALPLEDAATVYARALDQMDELLGDTDLVEEASSYLGMLTQVVTLTPDEAAPHGIAAEILLNPSAWLPEQAGSDPDAPEDGTRIPC